MLEILLATAAGLLSGLAVGAFVHRARYRAWSAERALLKSQIEDDEGLSDIDFDELVETTLRNRAMGVEPMGLAAIAVKMREAAGISGIDRSNNIGWNRPVTYGDYVPRLVSPYDWEPDDTCDCQLCDGARRRRNYAIISGGKL